MSTNAIFAELHDLLTRLCDAELEQSDWDRLETLLLDNPDAQDYYSRFTALDVDLAWRAAGDDQEAGIRDQGPEDRSRKSENGTLSSLPSLPTTHHPLPAAFIGGPVFSYMVATVVLCLMLLGAWAYKISHTGDSYAVDDSRRSTHSGQPEAIFVGKVTGMKDCRWSDPKTQTIVGASVSLDREYALASGLLEITYKTGARVILEGPCKYKVVSNASGYLEIGKLTARMETKGSGFRGRGSEDRGQRSEASSLIPHPSSFVVTTPTAIVTDLGTEFGVEVAANGDTISYVFQGSIKVQGLAASAASGAILKENESILVSRVRKTHQNSNSADLVRFTHPAQPYDGKQFVRELPSAGSSASPAAYSYRFGVNGEFDAADDDLIAAGSATLAGLRRIQGDIIHQGSLSKINDGGVYGDYKPGTTYDAITTADGLVIEAALNTARHPAGYDVFSIVSLTGCAGEVGGQPRTSQKYDVAYSTVDAPDRFVPLRCDREATVNRNSLGWAEMQITLTGVGGRTLARRVAKLRFTFHDTDSRSPESIYREIDVFGKVSGKQGADEAGDRTNEEEL